jgi:group I intron endonuclease
MVGIYKITNPKNAIYIGQSIDIIKRFNDYEKLRCKSQTKLYYSLKKYGYDAHKFEIITECDIDQLNNLERYYQDLYNVMDNKFGLNLLLTKSDDRSIVISSDSKEKISNTLKRKYQSGELIHPFKGKKFSDEHKNKLSEAKKRLYENGYINHFKGKKGKQSWNKGKKQSEETRIKISEIQKKRYENGDVVWNKGKKMSADICQKNREAQKKLYQSGYVNPFAKMVIDLETGFVYYSAKEAWNYNREYIKIGYDGFKSKLNGINKNNTKFIYA